MKAAAVFLVGCAVGWWLLARRPRQAERLPIPGVDFWMIDGKKYGLVEEWL